MKNGLTHHFKEVFKSPQAAMVGGLARFSMKQMATTLNLYVPAVITRSISTSVTSKCSILILISAGFA